MAKTSPPSLTEFEMMSRVAARFPKDKGWATFRGIRNHRGFSPPKGQKTRTLDGMSVGLWQSLKGEVLGFECKSSREDFLKEMSDPTKSDAFYPHCNRFWLVIGNSKVASPDEIPMGWGLLVPRGETLVEKKRAPRKKTEGLTNGIMLSLLAASSESCEARLSDARFQVRKEMEAKFLNGDLVDNKVAELERKLKYANSRADTADSRAAGLLEAREQAMRDLEALSNNPGLDAASLQRIASLEHTLRSWQSGGLNIRGLRALVQNMNKGAETLSQILSVLDPPASEQG